jgi:hypothetical protein
MKFFIFITSHIRMGWIKSFYEDKYLIFKRKIQFKKKCSLLKKVFCPKIKTIHIFHCIFLTVSQNAMKKSVPRVECVFQHTLKILPRSSKNCIHNCVTGCLSSPPDWHLSFRGLAYSPTFFFFLHCNCQTFSQWRVVPQDFNKSHAAFWPSYGDKLRKTKILLLIHLGTL